MSMNAMPALNLTAPPPQRIADPAANKSAEIPAGIPAEIPGEIPYETSRKGAFDEITDAVGSCVGFATGVVAGAFHVLPGVVKGVSEALAEEKGTKNAFPFQFAFYTQNAVAATVGCGVIGAVTGVGADIGFLAGVAGYFPANATLVNKAEKLHAYDQMIETVEAEVATIFETDKTVTLDKVIESGVIGAAKCAEAGGKVGFAVGFDATRSVGEGVKYVGRKAEWVVERAIEDPIAGTLEGIYEAGKDVIREVRVGGGLPQEPRNAERTGVREVLGAVVGTPFAVAGMAASAVAGPFVGAFTGVFKEGGQPNGLIQEASTTLTCIGAGAAAGAAALGPIGATVGGIGGLLYARLIHRSNASDQVSGRTAERVLNAVADNDETHRSLRRGAQRLVEGTLTGTVFNAAEGASKGLDSGAGLVSGLIDGAVSFCGSVGGNYVQDVPAEKPADGAGIFRKMLRGAAGIVMGTVGSALSTVDGVLRGSGLTLDAEATASASFHEGLFTSTALIAAGTAGFVLAGGWLPAMLGVALTAGGARLVHNVNERTGAAQKVADGITQAVRHSLADNSYVNAPEEKKNVYEVVRDSTEGTMAAAGAGLREGFGEGYTVGSEIVDGVLNATRDLTQRTAARFGRRH